MFTDIFLVMSTVCAYYYVMSIYIIEELGARVFSPIYNHSFLVIYTTMAPSPSIYAWYINMYTFLAVGAGY